MGKPKVVLGVSGGIAAYKACELLRRLTESGHDVRVVPTASALHFVGAATWSALSGHPVSTEVWETSTRCRTSASGRRPTWWSWPRRPPTCSPRPPTASPTTSSPTPSSPPAVRSSSPPPCTPRCGSTRPPRRTWRRCAAGAPSSSTPPSGRLTGVDTGKGRLPDPAEIFEVCRRVLARGVTEPDLAGRHVVVSAGGTREPLDPVRFLGNRSSGKQGYALARTAAARGARVTLIAANTGLPDPAGVDVVRVGTAVQLREAVLKAAAGRRRGGDGGGGGRLPPGDVRRREDQEEGRPGARAHRPGA